MALKYLIQKIRELLFFSILKVRGQNSRIIHFDRPRRTFHQTSEWTNIKTLEGDEHFAKLTDKLTEKKSFVRDRIQLYLYT